MKKLLLIALVAGAGASALALTNESASGDVTLIADSASSGALFASGEGGGDKPDKQPDDKPDKKPDDEGGGSEGVLTLNSGVNTLDGGEAGAILSSTNSDENVILVQTNGTSLTISNYTLNKSGDCTSDDNSNFFAVNAVVAAKSGGTIHIDNSTLNSNANGANMLFASGDGSTIYAYNCTLTSTEDSSRGLDATYEGTVIGSGLTIRTQGDHCAAMATDRGNGNISATASTLSTAGQGSPLIYSTGIIEVNGVTGTATGAQIAGIEGLSKIRIRNSDLSGSGEKASEPIANGVIIYQSNSGDYTEGKATFEVSDSTVKSAITNGAMFYVTHTEADITVQNTVFKFDTDSNYLLDVAGNDGEHGWGTAGSNGAVVVFSAIDQTLAGNVAVDGISSLDMYLIDANYAGTFVNDTTNDGDGEVNLHINSNSTWTVTADCTLRNLTIAPGAKIWDDSGKSVSIVSSEGTIASGESAITVTVDSYTSGTVVAANTITDFEIDRSAFEETYGTSKEQESEGGGSGGTGGGVEDHDGWTYYFKPHPPDNAIVKVKVDGATDYGTPDRDHKYCLDDYWDGTGGVKVRLLYVTQEGYLFADGCTSNVWETTITENEQEVYPPDDVVAVKAQAKSGKTYYLTLKEAIESANDRAKISLNDNVTLEETLTVTNSITLDLATNVVTLGSALTSAIHFTASATVSNGTINSSLATNVEDSCLLRFTDCKATLKDLTVNGRGYETVVAYDSAKGATDTHKSSTTSKTMICDGLVLTGNGCLLAVDYSSVTLTNECAFTINDTIECFGKHEAAIYCTSNGTVAIVGGAYEASTVLMADDFGVFYKSDSVTIAAPDGYAWENGRLVEGAASGAVTPGVASEPYDDAQSATNAAAKINADKDSGIVVPAGVEESAKETYLNKVVATVTSDNRVIVELTTAAETEVQGEIDGAVTNETAVASLTSTNASAKVTIATTTPGLYYWIKGGTDLNAVTNAGKGVLSTNGGAVELAKPTLDATEGKAFFKVAAGVVAP